MLSITSWLTLSHGSFTMHDNIRTMFASLTYIYGLMQITSHLQMGAVSKSLQPCHNVSALSEGLTNVGFAAS